MESLVIYSNDICPNCDKLKQALKQHNVNYQEINLTASPEHADILREKGLRSLPVINMNDEWLHGFTRNNFMRIMEAKQAVA